MDDVLIKNSPVIDEKNYFSEPKRLWKLTNRLINFLLKLLKYVFVHILFIALLFTLYQQVVSNNDKQIIDLYFYALRSSFVIRIGILFSILNLFLLSDY